MSGSPIDALFVLAIQLLLPAVTTWLDCLEPTFDRVDTCESLWYVVGGMGLAPLKFGERATILVCATVGERPFEQLGTIPKSRT